MSYLTRLSVLYLSLNLLPAAPVFAVDGVIEINQARALAGGVTPGDTPGFPVTIDQPGSYRLTSELVTSTPFGILIQSSDVTVDLGGFTLRSTSGSNNGIEIGSALRTIVLRNGILRGWRDGIYANHGTIDVEISGVSSSENLRNGIASNAKSTVVRDCVAVNNGSDGIVLFGFGTDSEAETYLIEGSIAKGNGRNGFVLTDGIITRSVSAGNDILGLSIYNGGHGVAGYHGNSFVGNNGGNANAQVDSFAIELGPNICGTNTTCP